MNKRILKFVKTTYYKFSSLQPIIKYFQKTFFAELNTKTSITLDDDIIRIRNEYLDWFDKKCEKNMKWMGDQLQKHL